MQFIGLEMNNSTNTNNEINIEKFLPRDLRLSKLYIKRIYERWRESINTSDIKTLNEFNGAIKEYIKNQPTNHQKTIIKELIRDKHSLFIDKSKFDWIKNDRIVFFIWGVFTIKPFILQSNKTKNLSINIISINRVINKSRTLSEMKDDIIEFIDNLPTFSDGKIEILDRLKKSWYQVNESFKKIFLWLNKKDEEQCEWSWNYIKERSDICKYLSPVTCFECYSFTHIAFDLWDISIETKKHFLINIAKANNQKIFRKKSESKRCLNTYISLSAKDGLDYLTDTKNMKINEVIEYLIKNEVNRIKSMNT